MVFEDRENVPYGVVVDVSLKDGMSIWIEEWTSFWFYRQFWVFDSTIEYVKESLQPLVDGIGFFFSNRADERVVVLVVWIVGR